MLLEGVRPNLSLLGLADRLKRPLLVLLISDDCLYCQQDVPKWISAFEGGLRPEAEILIISKDGHQLARRVFRSLHPAAAGIRLMELTQAQASALAARTGITATPMLLLLDGEGAIRLIGNRLNDKLIDTMNRLLQRELTSHEASRE